MRTELTASGTAMTISNAVTTSTPGRLHRRAFALMGAVESRP